MKKIYSYEMYRNRTNNSLLEFFKDYLKYDEKIDISSVDIALDNTNIFIEEVNKANSIAIIGDYDVDGVTSTAIMYKGLKKFGVKDVYTLIPNRFSDGYGMNKDLVIDCYNKGVSLIITVDNGIRAFEAINLANQYGIKVIVTDHHLPDEILPNAYCIINPHIGNDILKTKDICGAMTAYLLIKELIMDSNIELMCLAAIGTICDVMPLKYENRAIVKKLIKAANFNNTINNKGLDLLLHELKQSFINFNVETISFTVGPMINAAGRLKSADLALDILIDDDTFTLKKNINELISINNERKEISRDLKNKANSLIIEDDLSNVIYIDEANEGLIGVCASAICQDTNKPTFIFTGGEEGFIKGSGRSPLWCNLIDTLSPILNKLDPIAYGGHSGAMGLTLRSKNDLAVLKNELNLAISSMPHEEALETYLRYPLGFDISEVKDILDTLAPFGEGLKEPCFVTRANIFGASALGSLHTKFSIELNGKMNSCLYFFNKYNSNINGLHDVYFNIKKEMSSYSHKLEYKLFIKNVS